MTEKINKTNEQLHQEFEDALKNLEEKLYNLLQYGSYALTDLMRDFKTNKVNHATMKVGKHHLFLKCDKYCYSSQDGTEVTLHFDNNPVSEEMMESWDRLSIQKDIDYYQKQLDALIALQKEQQKKVVV